MSRRYQRLRRVGLVALYIVLLALWGGLGYDTYGEWLKRQSLIARGLAQAAIPPTPLPLPELAQPTALPIPTIDSGVPTQPLPIQTVIPLAHPKVIPVTHPKTGRSIAAWLPTAFDADAARVSFEANKDILDEVSPFWYFPNPATGALVPEPGARDQTLVDEAHHANVLVIPTIHNVYDPLGVLPMLRDPDRRKKHIAAIMDELHTFGFDGIDLDYESLPAASRPFYSEFLRELSTALHAEGKLLTVAVHAKATDDGGLGAFQNWTLIGELSDHMRIMTYDFHWMGGEAGPIAPLSWVAGVAEYARAVVPAAKIQLGVPFYAYDWAEGEDAHPATWTDVQRLIAARKPSVNLLEQDATGEVDESFFTYRKGGKTRTVWFASYRSLASRLDFVEQEDLGGIAIWRLGNEDPRNWKVIRQQFIENTSAIQRAFEQYLPEH